MYLNCHSYYSFKYGTLSPEALLTWAIENELNKVALTDINTTAGSLKFIRLAQEQDVAPIVGIDFRNGNAQQYVGLAKNNKGFEELNNFLSAHLHDKVDFPEIAPNFENAYIIYPFKNRSEENTKGRKLKKNEFIGIHPSDISKFTLSPLKQHRDKLVLLATATFRNKRDFNTHRLLRAIDKNTLLSKLPKIEEGHPEDIYNSPQELSSRFQDHEYLLKNTRKLLAECGIYFDFSGETVQNLGLYTGSSLQDFELLRRLCLRGLKYRYPEYNFATLRRLVKELQLIRQKNFVAYFLINCKIVSYARKKGYFYIGRGSGANSMVAYLIRITDVDPIDLDLYFERFINLYRENPPDFDIDFSSHEREDVTKFIFEYFNNKTPNGVALLASYSTFKYRAAVRELGKVFGLPPHEIDKIAAGGKADDELSNMVLRYSSLIAGFPNHLTVHAGGILMAQKPIHYYTATSMPPKGFPTTHFDMHEAEDVGLHKFDILGQRGLGKIKDTLSLVRQNQPAEPLIDIHDFKRLKKDPGIKKLLREANAIGCFYVESPAMRMLLKKLEAEDYLSLVAASSIIRPGVAKSGMMREYILRFRNPERRKEAHPVLWDIMPDTFGVMVYQEDVIKVAHYFAGLNLGEADALRRGMSGKFRSKAEFERVKKRYFENCKKKGHDDALAAEIWRQIESFAGYAFAKGHSASYAVESYQSLYLKAYYPLEYMVAVLNNGGGFYRKELYVHEARMHGAQIEAPCVNRSRGNCVIEGNTIYLALGMVKDLEDRVIFEILNARKFGVFQSVHDFINRVSVSLEQLIILIRVGAFRFSNKNKKELLWEAHFLLGHAKKSKPSPGLFDIEAKEFKLPKLHIFEHEDSFEEIELIGFPLCNPFSLLNEVPAHFAKAADFSTFLNRQLTIYGYLITVKNTGTSNGKRMNFGTFIDIDGRFIDTVHFPPSAIRYPFRGKGIYKMTGKVVEEFGFYTLEVDVMEKCALIDDPRYTDDVARLKVVDIDYEGGGKKKL